MTTKSTFTVKDLLKACKKHHLEKEILVSPNDDELHEFLKDKLKDYNMYISKEHFNTLRKRLDKEQLKIDDTSTSTNDSPSTTEPPQTKTESTNDDPESEPEVSTPQTPENIDNPITSNSSHIVDAAKMITETVKQMDEFYSGSINMLQKVNDIDKSQKNLESMIMSIMKITDTIDEDCLPPNTDIIISNSNCVSVDVNKEIINKLAKYVDTNNLLNFEVILRNNANLSSIIVQTILLIFIHEKKL